MFPWEIILHFYQLAKKRPAVLFIQIIRNLHKLPINNWKSLAPCDKLLKNRAGWPFWEKVQLVGMRLANLYSNHGNNYTALCPHVNPCITPAR